MSKLRRRPTACWYLHHTVYSITLKQKSARVDIKLRLISHYDFCWKQFSLWRLFGALRSTCEQKQTSVFKRSAQYCSQISTKIEECRKVWWNYRPSHIIIPRLGFSNYYHIQRDGQTVRHGETNRRTFCKFSSIRLQGWRLFDGTRRRKLDLWTWLRILTTVTSVVWM